MASSESMETNSGPPLPEQPTFESASNQCSHIIQALADAATAKVILDKFKSVVAWNVHHIENLKRPSKRRKVAAPTCKTCDVSLSRPLVCLHCSYAGCWWNGHISGHLKDAKHEFCADVKSGYIFCSTCDDFVYNPIMENIHLSTVISAEEKQTRFQAEKNPREPFRPWEPNAKENAALEGAMALPCQGRRGLLNLGQTCYLNVVLQCLIHNPLLRNYFLSDKHNWNLCKLKEKEARDCTCCEMDKLFSEIYSNDSSPYGPISFLATTWRASSELSGYAQQDTHEFFISALNQIHTTSRGHTNVSCNCVVHSTFAGQYQSDVKCERCGNVTSTVDPLLDISLELKGKGGEPVSGENTLGACLRRHTHPEKLGPKEYSCAKCGNSSHEASKRLSIRKLPPVISFQFKRFEHKATDNTSAHKIDTPIRFPSSLNMAPYTTLVMNMDDQETEMETGGPPYSYPGPEAMYEYDLFAVINHEGQIDNGHYTNYARFQDEWYHFDDEKVTHSTLGSCLNSTAYMCFYVKRHLDYKPYMRPTYVLTRETEAVREKEMEKEKEAQEKEKEAARMKEVEDALLATV